ncbi:MAG: McrC family protein [Phycisphaerales bacterium JB058]
MRRLTLTEYSTTSGVALDAVELAMLRGVHPTLRIEPAVGLPGRFDLTPNQHIGLVQLPTIAIEIQPKISMSSVVFLVSYAADRMNWSRMQTAWQDDATLVDLIATVLCRSIERSTRKGLLAGYRSHEESLSAPRGRIRFPEHISKRLGQAPPIEIEHDLFTTDIIENRVLLSALSRLRRLPLRSMTINHEIGRAARLFGGVELIHYPKHSIPDPVITQLNRHYEAALRIAQLVLRSSSVDIGSGARRADAFLVDMNAVFELFLRTALRESLRCPLSAFPDRPPRLRLDAAEHIPLKPDLCLIASGRIVWVGDAKYKRLSPAGYQNADVYQMLAYLTATGLPSGMLIYAADAGLASTTHVIEGATREVRIRTLDLRKPPSGILREVALIADEIQSGQNSPEVSEHSVD